MPERHPNRRELEVEDGSRHGIAAPRGLSAASAASGGRFTRMFGHLPPGNLGVDAIEALAVRLEACKDQSVDGRIPAGYTYLAQFVDHDITFDPTSILDRDNDPHALSNFRTPCFDLDSVYGSGPAGQPYLYDWTTGDHPGVKLLVGEGEPGPDCKPVADLPRNGQGRAIIGDARNDENLIVSQLHLLFMQFHNKVAQILSARRWPTSAALFDEARRIVRWHYQWVVVRDLLRKLVGTTMWESLLPTLTQRPGITEPSVDLRFYRPEAEPAVPVEFSAAAYRFGHSMVRNGYVLRPDELEVPIFPPACTQTDRHLGGFRPLIGDLKVDWPHFFDPDRGPRSFKIDHSLTAALFALPPDGASLARLNLHRGRALGLPSGSDVARALGQEPLAPQKLLPPELWPENDQAELRTAVLDAPPLWLYILREAQEPGFVGLALGPVGGRIVGEVLVGLLMGDPQSYVRRQPTWTPRLPRARSEPEAQEPTPFTMTDLIAYTLAPDGAA